jgi:hypothetical protein
LKQFSEADVARELLLEWRDPYLNLVYRGGFAYTVLRVVRSLTSGYRDDPFGGPFGDDQLGVAYFLNDYRTLEEHRRRVPNLRIVHLNGVNLGFITRQRGIRWVLANLWRGAIALREAEASSNGKSRAMPLLGWLLYRHLVDPAPERSEPSRYVVANIIHPALVGAMFAFARRGVPVDFVEHAMTPRVLMRPLPIDDAYILSAHTVDGWRQELPTSTTRLHLLGDPSAYRPSRNPLPVEPRVLVCVNPADTLDGIASALRAVVAVGGKPTVRLHDADARASSVTSLASSLGARVSLASRSPITADLDQSDLVICGNSNALMDSVRRQRRVVYFWPDEPSRFDFYGFVRYYDVEFATSESDLRGAIAAMICAPRAPQIEADERASEDRPR